jgi:uncharacterized protein YkwD
MPDSISIGAAYRDQKIVGGAIDNTVIGATTAAAGTFAALTATALTATGAVNLAATSAIAVGFYGATAVAQRQSSAMPAVATTAAINSSISSSCFGFTSAQATAIVTLVNELRAAAVALGLIAT